MFHSPSAHWRRSWRRVAVLSGLLLGAGLVHAADDKLLNIYSWSDYIGDDTVANFEKETGIKVRYDTFDANETLHAKLVAGKTGYDVVVPSSNWLKVQAEGGLLMKLDKSQIPNYNNLNPMVLQQVAAMDAGNTYAVPYMWGFTTLGYNSKKVKAALGNLPMPENAWDLLFKPEYALKLKQCGVSVLDSGDEVFPAVLHYLGKPPHSTDPADYKEAAAVLRTIRPAIRRFSSSGYINEMASGSLCLAMGWNGDLGIARTRARQSKNGVDIVVTLPSGGAGMFIDTMAIPADAPHVANAYKWISYILRPEVHAGIVNKVRYAAPVPASSKFVDPAVAADPTIYMSKEDMARLFPPGYDSNDIRRVRTRWFTSFRTGRW